MPLARPIILNGIEDVITRPDLADRAIFVTLPHVQEERRRAEKEIWCDFESAQPHILGALLDAASHVGWPRSPRALAGRLRRAQTPLRALGIEISFGREGRAGTRIIRLRASRTKPTRMTVSTVSTVD
jgi:hypothetical protein